MKLSFCRSALQDIITNKFPDAVWAERLLSRMRVDRYDADFDYFCEAAGVDDRAIRASVEEIYVIDDCDVKR